jgi:hypothetical protein
LAAESNPDIIAEPAGMHADAPELQGLHQQEDTHPDCLESDAQQEQEGNAGHAGGKFETKARAVSEHVVRKVHPQQLLPSPAAHLSAAASPAAAAEEGLPTATGRRSKRKELLKLLKHLQPVGEGLASGLATAAGGTVQGLAIAADLVKQGQKEAVEKVRADWLEKAKDMAAMTSNI